MAVSIANNQIYWAMYRNFKKESYNMATKVGLEWYRTLSNAWVATSNSTQPKLDIYWNVQQIQQSSDPFLASSQQKNVYVEYSFLWADLVLAMKGINQTAAAVTDPTLHIPYYANNFSDFNTLMTTPVPISTTGLDITTMRGFINFKIDSGRFLTLYDYTIDPYNCIVKARGEILTAKTKY